MDIIEILAQVRELLQQQGRISYRILKRQFALDDEALEDLKFELIEVQELAIDKDGKMVTTQPLDMEVCSTKSAICCDLVTAQPGEAV